MGVYDGLRSRGWGWDAPEDRRGSFGWCGERRSGAKAGLGLPPFTYRWEPETCRVKMMMGEGERRRTLEGRKDMAEELGLIMR